MKKISEHLGQIIVALAAIALVISTLTLFSAPVSDFFGEIVDKQSNIGQEMMDSIEVAQAGLSGGGGSGDSGSGESLVHNGPEIPEGGYYGGIDMETGTFITYETMPQNASIGDFYVYGDYCYLLANENGWVVDLNDEGSFIASFGLPLEATTDSNQISYGPILKSINGKYITEMEYTFVNCVNLVTAPEIPDTVTYMYGAFSGCTSLSAAPKIPNSVTNLACAFDDCASLNGIISIPCQITEFNLFNCTATVERYHYDGCGH